VSTRRHRRSGDDDFNDFSDYRAGGGPDDFSDLRGEPAGYDARGESRRSRPDRYDGGDARGGRDPRDDRYGNDRDRYGRADHGADSGHGRRDRGDGRYVEPGPASEAGRPHQDRPTGRTSRRGDQDYRGDQGDQGRRGSDDPQGDRGRRGDRKPPGRAARGTARASAAVPVVVPSPPDKPKPDSGDPLGLIPGPDETTILPRIPSKQETDFEVPQVPESRRKRAIRRHRDDTPVGGNKARTVVRTGAEILATIGGIVLLFSAYLLWGTNAEINAAQEDQGQALTDTWADEDAEDPTLDPVPGGAIAQLYMPQIRPEPWVIVEGTTLEDIEKAPGHYEDHAMPGEKGNFAVAGHNVEAIFRHIDDLQPGDEIVVETKTSFFIYEVTEHSIVDDTDWDVVEPVPNKPGVEPGEGDRWLTLTTCHPWWDNYERYVVFANLTDTRERGNTLPPEAKG
jgi:sortase A